MKKKTFVIAFLLTFAAFSLGYGAQEIPVLWDRETVLTFPDEIFKASQLDKNKYEMSVDGPNIRLRALSIDSPKCTLSVRYGEKGKLTYVADIFPSNTAPSHWKWDWSKQRLVEVNGNTSGDSSLENKQEIREVGSMTNSQIENLFNNLKQQYWDLGLQDDGVVVMVPQIVLHEKKTYIKIWIKNDTHTFLKLQKPIFENVSYTWKYLVWREKNVHPSEPFLCPSMEVGPASMESFIFAFPTFITNGGMDVYLREDPKEGLREYKFNIPASVLLKASRQ